VSVVVGCGGNELVDDVEADVLDAVVGVEAQPQVASRRLDERRPTSAAEPADDRRRVAERTVDDLQVVVRAVFRRLDVELVAKVQSYPVIRRRCNNQFSLHLIFV